MDYAKRSLLRLAASVTLLGAPLALQGQERTAAPREPESKSHYATEQPEDNGLAVELHSASRWDNNILGDNAHRIHDHVFEQGGLLSRCAKKPEWRLGLDYRRSA